MKDIKSTPSKVYIKYLIDVVIYLSFYVIILLSTSAITIHFIRIKELKTAIQMKNVHILALITSCKMDFLIKQRRPDMKEKNHD